MRSPTYQRADGTRAQMDTSTGLVHLVDEHDADTGQTVEPDEKEAAVMAGQQQAITAAGAAAAARADRDSARAAAMAKVEAAAESSNPEVRDLAEALVALTGT